MPVPRRASDAGSGTGARLPATDAVNPFGFVPVQLLVFKSPASVDGPFEANVKSKLPVAAPPLSPMCASTPLFVQPSVEHGVNVIPVSVTKRWKPPLPSVKVMLPRFAARMPEVASPAVNCGVGPVAVPFPLPAKAIDGLEKLSCVLMAESPTGDELSKCNPPKVIEIEFGPVAVMVMPSVNALVL